MRDCTLLDSRQNLSNVWNKRAEHVNIVARCYEHNDAEVQYRYILLEFQVPVNRQKNVAFLFGKA